MHAFYHRIIVLLRRLGVLFLGAGRSLITFGGRRQGLSVFHSLQACGCAGAQGMVVRWGDNGKKVYAKYRISTFIHLFFCYTKY